jgi:hypothetical protein
LARLGRQPLFEQPTTTTTTTMMMMMRLAKRAKRERHMWLFDIA